MARDTVLIAKNLSHGIPRVGHCPVCAATGSRSRTLFVLTGSSLREGTRCLRCRSNARNRALLHTLQSEAPGWRGSVILEAGGGSHLTAALSASCPGHIPSQYLPHVPRGGSQDGVRSEDLEALTLPSASVDLVVTEDVLEHVHHPTTAFTEIARVLRPGGMHIFTIPFHGDAARTKARVEVLDDGSMKHLAPAEYHGDPLSPDGVLVITDFGGDLPEIIERSSSMTTEVRPVHGVDMGVLEPCVVFISRKATTDPPAMAHSGG